MKNFIIFGASGDLAFDKIYPALYLLFRSGIKCDRYFGYARSDILDFSERLEDAVKKSVKDINLEQLKEFSDRWSYISGDSYGKDGLNSLSTNLNKGDQNTYYLALPIVPDIVDSLIGGLEELNLISDSDLFVFEKPFGRDYKSAKELADLIRKYLDDSQVWMVDHYLGKNMVRNIVSIRFANPLFQSAWKNNYIDHIEISATETEGVKERGGYYDRTGAIKDMVQNHLLQVLALITMESDEITENKFRKAKQDLISSVRIYIDNFADNLEIKQYKGYRSEEKVGKDSLTETYAKLKVEINDDRWNGVPVTLKTGKKLEKKETKVEIFFKKMVDCIWKTKCDLLEPNKITIWIYPEQAVEIKINSGFTPLRELPQSVNLKFDLGGDSNSKVFDSAHANVLKDIYNRDFIYAISLEEVLLSWRFIDKVMDYLEVKRSEILEQY
jgi:glucose-6-phosphate 1-dehydrogenase